MNYKQKQVKIETLKVIAEHNSELFEKYPAVKGEEIQFGNMILCSINDCEDTEKYFNETKRYRQYRIEARKRLKKRGII